MHVNKKEKSKDQGKHVEKSIMDPVPRHAPVHSTLSIKKFLAKHGIPFQCWSNLEPLFPKVKSALEEHVVYEEHYCYKTMYVF